MVFMAKQAGKPTRVTHKTAYLWIKRKLQAKKHHHKIRIYGYHKSVLNLQ